MDRRRPACPRWYLSSHTPLQQPPKQAEVKTAPGRGKVRSVLLNANPDDTGSQTRRLRLTLGYAANLDKVGTIVCVRVDAHAMTAIFQQTDDILNREA